MKEIEDITEEEKDVTDEINSKAKKNAKGFDLTKMNYKQILKLINSDGFLVGVLDCVLPFAVDSDNQIKFKAINLGYTQETNEEVYPLVDLYFGVKKKRVEEEINLCLSLTPFNAALSNFEKISKEFGGYDKELTMYWRNIMKTFFKEKYRTAFKKYCLDSQVVKEKEIKARSLRELRENDTFYAEEIGSI